MANETPETNEAIFNDTFGRTHRTEDLDSWEIWEYSEAHIDQLDVLFTALKESHPVLLDALNTVREHLNEFAEEQGFLEDDDEDRLEENGGDPDDGYIHKNH